MNDNGVFTGNAPTSVTIINSSLKSERLVAWKWTTNTTDIPGAIYPLPSGYFTFVTVNSLLGGGMYLILFDMGLTLHKLIYIS